MSIATEARNRTDDVVEQGKFAVTSVRDRIASLTADTRGRSREAAGDTKGLAHGFVDRARRQMYVQIGVNDAILAVVAKRSSEFPGDVKQVVANLTDAGKDRVGRANERATEVQDRLKSVANGLVQRGSAAVDTVREINLRDTTAGAKDSVENRVEKVQDAVGKLANRGEQVVEDLRHDPVIARVIGGADTGVEKATNQLMSVAQKLRDRAAAQRERENATVTSTPVRPVPAEKIPAHTTVARKTLAGDAAISATPTHRAVAHEAEIRHEAGVKAAKTRKKAAESRAKAAEARKATARLAAETRRVNAEKAAAKRAAAALKAAETRKENNEARERAAETRKTAARKAAKTRKENSPAKASGHTADAEKTSVSAASTD
jgi:hypothetical protein